jgi:pyruvate kinase
LTVLQDIDDLQNFACKHKVDFVAASFVQSKEDVLYIRKILDEAGGQDVKIISKIENMAGLNNFDGVHTDAMHHSAIIGCHALSRWSDENSASIGIDF